MSRFDVPGKRVPFKADAVVPCNQIDLFPLRSAVKVYDQRSVSLLVTKGEGNDIRIVLRKQPQTHDLALGNDRKDLRKIPDLPVLFSHRRVLSINYFDLILLQLTVNCWCTNYIIFTAFLY